MPWHLIVLNLLSRPLRTILTVLSLVAAIFLICFLSTVVGALKAGVEASAQDRLIVQSAVSLFVNLPEAYQTKIEDVPGVESAMKMQWFGGIYQKPENFFAQFGIDHERFFATYPEVKLVEGQASDFLTRRQSCVIGKKLADRYDFKLGNRIPIQGTIFPRLDGKPWEFDVAGIFVATSANVDENTLFFHFDYLRESLEGKAASGPPGAGVYVLRTSPGADIIAISSRIDSTFDGGPQRVQTTTEKEFQRQFLTMLGSVPTLLSSIGGAVLFAILLAVLNTMLMAGRQRTRDFGIMKAMGFTDSVAFRLMIFESLLLSISGGALGCLVAKAAEKSFAGMLGNILPSFVISTETIGLGMGLSVAIGIFAGILPAWQASRLDPVEAMRANI